jgi:hypothetical protein
LVTGAALVMARRPKFPFDLATLRANGVTRLRYKGPNDFELEMAPAAPTGVVSSEAVAAWVDAADDTGPPVEDDEGDPRFLLERIAEANSRKTA